jgi:hypothetical protein
MPRNSVTGELSGTGGGVDQSTTATVNVNGDTLPTTVDVVRSAPGGAITGVILQPGTYAGQRVTVVNESAAASTITFAAAGTSNVADGVTTVIPGLRASTFWWDTGTSRWYRTA